MKEYPDYKYRPRRKPKPLIKKDLCRYPFPFITPPGLDPLNPVTQRILSYNSLLPGQSTHPYPDHHLPSSLRSFVSPSQPSSEVLPESGVIKIKEEPETSISPVTSPHLPSNDDHTNHNTNKKEETTKQRRTVEAAHIMSAPEHSDSPNPPDSTTSPAPKIGPSSRVSSPPPLTILPSLPCSTAPRPTLPLLDIFQYSAGLYPPLLHPYLHQHLVPPYVFPTNNIHALLSSSSLAHQHQIARPIPKLPSQTTIKTEPAEFHIRPPTAAQNSNL